MVVDADYVNPLPTYSAFKVIFVDHNIFYTADSVRRKLNLASIDPSHPTEQVFLRLKMHEGRRLDLTTNKISATSNAPPQHTSPDSRERLPAGTMISNSDGLDVDRIESMNPHHLFYLANDGTFKWIEINHSGVYQLPRSSLILYVIFAGSMDSSIFEWLAEYKKTGISHRNPSIVDAIIEISH